MKNNNLFRSFYTIILVLGTALYTQAQTVTKYYDINWNQVAKERAVYYGEFVKEGDAYKFTSYSVKSNGLRAKGTYPDTVLREPVGLILEYNDKGKLIDSSLYENNVLVDAYHYYDNGQLEVHYYVPVTTNKPVTEAYDEAGKKIKNYVFGEEATFKGGDEAWKKYIAKNLNKEFKVKKKGDPTTVTVHVQFIISESGQVIQPKIAKSSGLTYIDREAMAVIAASPQWNNAILRNKPVKAYRIQPITYILIDK